MKKSRTQWELGATDGHELIVQWAILGALDRNTKRLATRLRLGESSRAEMAFAADLIEGKVKLRRRRSNQPTRITNKAMAEFYFCLQAMHPKWPKEEVRKQISDMFGVKDRHVYNVLRALDPEDRKYYERNARARVIRGSPDWDKDFMREAIRQITRIYA